MQNLSDMSDSNSKRWVVIFGASSGLGLATAQKLSQQTYSFLLVHFDRQRNMAQIAPDFSGSANQMVEINTNIHSDKGISLVQHQILANIGLAEIALFVYASTGANVGDITADDAETSLNKMKHTHQALAHGMVYWVLWLAENGFFAPRARAIALSFYGSHRAVPGYAYAGIAKASLEAGMKYLAASPLAKQIRFITVSPGVFDSPSSRAIAGIDEMLQTASRKNPSGRLTTPQDVANVIYLLMQAEADWINGANIYVDGGENLII